MSPAVLDPDMAENRGVMNPALESQALSGEDFQQREAKMDDSQGK